MAGGLMVKKKSKARAAIKSRAKGKGWGGARKGGGRKQTPLHVLAARGSRAPRVLQARKEGRTEELVPPDKRPAAVARFKEFIPLAEQYVDGVREGTIKACKWVRLACARHERDLERQGSPGFPYHFDPQAAAEACANIEKFPHIKGQWAREKRLLRLETWQVFVVCMVFGWKRANKKRRFRKVFLLVPRKNAKSTLAAAIGNLMMAMDGEFGAEVYCGATSEKQAWEVFGPARLMWEKSAALRSDHGVEVMARSIHRAADNSSFKPIIGKPGDGASPSCSIHDEYHEQDDPGQLDTMETGMGAREQPILLVISTAGTNLGSPCYDEQKAAEKVLEEVVEDETLFAIIYTIDMPVGKPGDADYQPGDDWSHPDSLEKANPNMGVSVDREWLTAQQRNAVINVAQQNRFMTKHLDVWCSASVAGINMHQWKLCADRDLRVEEFAGQASTFALDLASKIDVCDFAKLFTRQIGRDRDGKPVRHYYAFCRHYLPERTAEEPGPNQKNYEKWARMGRITLTPGAEVDFDLVRDDVMLDARTYQAREIVYDPWRATQLAHQLMKDGATVVEMAQTPKNMAAAFDEFLSAIKGGRFHHDGDPVLEWMASNVIAKEVMKGLTLPAKQKKESKIDGIVAIVMAIARAMVSDDGGGMDQWLKNPIMVSA
jgi:phage terminase large subunit-like protein